MPKIKHSEMRVVDTCLQSDPGYLLNFSDRTMAEFFEDEFGLDLNQRKYTRDGTSKMKRLRSFIQTEEGPLVARVLRRLWEYKEAVAQNCTGPISQELRNAYFGLIERLESQESWLPVDALSEFEKSQTLEELISDIKRTAAANKPQVALDRLHTYCMKQFSSLLEQRGEVCAQHEPLNSRYAKYIRYLEKEVPLTDMTTLALKSAISLFERYNSVRKNHSLAHDNLLLSHAEARFIYETVFAVLRLIKQADENSFRQ